jgi:outer membrane protein assembly factor BamB
MNSKTENFKYTLSRHALRTCRIAVLIPLAILALTLANCGGGSGGTPHGRFLLTVKWPEPNTRLIPVASTSIRAVLTRGDTTLGQQLLARPAQAPWTTTVAFNDVTPGAVTLTATAFPQPDGTGVAQARGSAPATIVGGQTAAVTVTMASTIDHVTITPDNPTIDVAATKQLAMTAYDAQDNVVLVAPGNVSWQSASQDKVTVNAAGLTTGVAVGSSQVTVTESESSKSDSTTVTVASGNGGCTPGPVVGPGGLSSGAPWPAQYHDVRNSSLGAGSGATGEFKWSATFSGFGLLTSDPTIGADGTVYVRAPGSQGPAVYALNPADGSIKWQSGALSDSVGAPMLGANGMIFVASSGLTALDGQNGSIRWSYGPAVSMPTAGPDGRIYVFARVNNQPEIVALDSSTGAVKWERAVSDQAARLAVAADGTVYAVGGADEDIVALDGNCGTVKWRSSNTPRGATGLPVVGADGTIYYRSAFSSPTIRAELVAVDPVSGAKKWAVDVPFGGDRPGLAVGPNGIIYLAADDGRLTAVSPAGAVQWTFTPQGVNRSRSQAPSVGGDGVIYYGVFATSGGPALNTVYAVNPNGTQKWATPSPTTNADVASIAIGGDGTLYISGRNTGKVAALK